MRGGRAHRARRRTAALAALGLLAAGCTDGSQGPQSLDAGSSPSRAGASPSSATAQGTDAFPAPEGMRWVARKQVALAVPLDWRVVSEPTQAASWVRVTRARAVPRLVGGRRVDLGGQAHGVRYATSGATCRDHHTRCALTMVVTASQTVFDLHYRGPSADDVLDSVVGSVRRLPEDVVAVPPVPFAQSDRRATAILREAGLVASPPGIDQLNYVVGSVPRAGTVVPSGSEVRVLLGDG